MLRRLAQRFDADALLFKDTIQSLRRGTFLLLLGGLLLLGEGATIAAVAARDDAAAAGRAILDLLAALLLFYLVMAGLGALRQCLRDFESEAMELLSLTGLTLEAWMRGKFLTLAVQAAFGFFCLLPYMFFAQLLGGGDLCGFAVFVALLAALVPPLFYLMLAGALFWRRFRRLGPPVVICAALGLLWLAGALVFMVAGTVLEGHDISALDGLGVAFRLALKLPWPLIAIDLAIFPALYVHACAVAHAACYDLAAAAVPAYAQARWWRRLARARAALAQSRKNEDAKTQRCKERKEHRSFHRVYSLVLRCFAPLRWMIWGRGQAASGLTWPDASASTASEPIRKTGRIADQ